MGCVRDRSLGVQVEAALIVIPHKSWGNLYAWMIGIFVERFILVPSFENPDSSKLWGCRVERACSRIGLL